MATIKIQWGIEFGRYSWKEAFYTNLTSPRVAVPLAKALAGLRTQLLRTPAVLRLLTVSQVGIPRSNIGLNTEDLLYSVDYDADTNTLPWEGSLVSLVQGVNNGPNLAPTIAAGSKRSYIIPGTAPQIWTGSTDTGWAPNAATQAYTELQAYLNFLQFPNISAQFPGVTLAVLGPTPNVPVNTMLPAIDPNTGFLVLRASPNPQANLINWTTPSYKLAQVSGFLLSSKKFNGRKRIINPTTDPPSSTASFMIPMPSPSLNSLSYVQILAAPVIFTPLPIGQCILLQPGKKNCGANKFATKGRYKARPAKN